MMRIVNLDCGYHFVWNLSRPSSSYSDRLDFCEIMVFMNSANRPSNQLRLQLRAESRAVVLGISKANKVVGSRGCASC